MSGVDEQEALDAITDRVFASAASPTVPNPAPRHWALSVERIFSDEGLRLDVSRFDPDLDAQVQALRDSKHDVDTLGNLAKVDLPSRFERVWAKDEGHGLPYLNATDLLSLFAIGVPSQTRYLSRQSNVDVDALVVRRNWLLMTCSGTIGRIFHVPGRLDGWVATHDLIRIRPKPGMVGYLFAWFMTESARTQVLSHTHGGQIDHVTADQVRSVLVPVLPKDQVRRIDQSVRKALRTREKGLAQLENLWPEG